MKLGLKENIHQFILLVFVNALVGSMIGLERTILPEIAEKEFGMQIKSAILSFIVVFGFTKAIMNYYAGRLSDHYGRKKILIWGWIFSIPIPFLLMWAKDWNTILLANVFLGISQGLTWSTTVIMKIDLVGSQKRGLAMGLNEFAGYFAVALSALLTGYIAANYGLRPEPFYLGFVYVLLGLFFSLFFIKETIGHVVFESRDYETSPVMSQKQIFYQTSFLDKNLSSITQAGFINNLNDGMAWGLYPIFFVASHMTLKEIGWLSAIYPASWGIFQLWTGYLSDSIGRKKLIYWGMWLQAIGIGATIMSKSFIGFSIGSLLLGIGTAMVYPTLLAAIGDVTHPNVRASSVGTYRLWRDSGYAFGAILAGITADLFGISSAMWLVAVITFLSGLIVKIRMEETLKKCITAEKLLPLYKRADAIIVDVRSKEEYDQGHITNALNIPLSELSLLMNSIPQNKIVITVCGKGGGRSDQAANLLRTLGFSAQWLCGGFMHWKENNLPID